MARILIVAYGNPLRCDDGLAWRAADELEKRFCGSDFEILRTHQLAPELAETVSRFETVIFVDAASANGTESSPGDVRSAAVTTSGETPRFSHQLSPGAVLALAAQLFGAAPRAFSVTLTGQCFDHGESLSPTVEAAIPALVVRVEELVRSALASEAVSLDRTKA
jgi:hydrogenase maturation protease